MSTISLLAAGLCGAAVAALACLTGGRLWLLARKRAGRIRLGGTTYRLCSQGHCERFRTAPDEYGTLARMNTARRYKLAHSFDRRAFRNE